MPKLKTLEDYRDEIKHCVKCGGCRAHCPAFGAEHHEGRVARGKIALADALFDGEVTLEEQFLLDMSQCLGCVVVVMPIAPTKYIPKRSSPPRGARSPDARGPPWFRRSNGTQNTRN